MNKLSTLLMGLSALSCSHLAIAAPSLQLDIDGGFYDVVDESTLTNSSVFTLRAFGNSAAPAFDLNNAYYLSASVIQNHSGIADGTNFGSFSIDGDSFALGDADVSFGTPPFDVSANIASHSIYPSLFTEITFSFVGANTVGTYNVQDDNAEAGTMFEVAYNIDASNLLAGFDLHFDLYTYGPNGGGKIKVLDFAPFSHDAATAITTVAVPESSMLALFSLGLLGLGLARRKQR